MKKSRHLNVLAFCAIAALSVSVYACGNETDGTQNDEKECSAMRPCPNGFVCNGAGKCEEAPDEPGTPDDNINKDPCKTINCPSGKSCLNAECIDTECIVNGAEMKCDGGQMCSKGVCVDDGCQDKVCEEGKSCIKGVCEDTLCYEANIVCNTGATCVKGVCVDNECLGMSCDEGFVCTKGDCVYPACVGKEACSTGKSCNEEGECVFDVAPALSAIADKNETDESGAVATISLSLNNAPTADVTVECTLAPEDAMTEAQVSCGGILFNADNYQSQQMVQVMGLPDNVIDEDKPYTFTVTTVSEDADFNGLSQSIEMVNKNIDTVGIHVEAAKMMTTESGGSAIFSIVLKAKPAADVTIDISSSNPEYGVIVGALENKLSVTFTPDNWEIPQEINVMGVDDGSKINDGEHQYQIVFGNAVSEDEHYNGLEIAAIDVMNLDNDIAEAFIDKTEIVTEEGGFPVDLKVRLGVEPSVNVYVSVKVFEEDRVTESDELEIISETELTLDKLTYLEGVTVSLQGVDDHIVDGDQAYAVQLSYATNDPVYKNVLKDQWVTGINVDKNVAGLTKNMPESTVSEDGTSIEIGLSLSVVPTADVTFDISSANTKELVVEPSSLTFTVENWATEQTIKVTGVDDNVIDGDVITDIILKATSEDKAYGGDGAELLAVEEKLGITNKDNDVANIVTNAAEVEVMENSGATLEYTVVLSAKPEGNVTIVSKSSDESELKILDSNIMVFSPSNWDQPKTVRLQVQDDIYADGAQTAYIGMTSTSGDPNFNDLKAQTVLFTILDNETEEEEVPE